MQERVLAQTLDANSDTAYGRLHGFGKITSARQFQERVPLTTFDDYTPYVARIAAGEQSVLSRDPVRVFEPSGGSTGAAKRIPYTRELQRQFSRAVAPWIFDLYRSDPQLTRGPAYWSISPAISPPEEAKDPVPVGFAEDREYLGGLASRLLGAVMAVPSDVRRVTDLEAFRYVTLAFLLGCPELRLISVWHPSFLTLLLEGLSTHWKKLLRDLREGRLRPPGGLAGSAGDALSRRFAKTPLRARQLQSLQPSETQRIWPKLRLLSCWGDGHAAHGLGALREAFPSVSIQPKGLIATEGIVTVPVSGETVLAVRSHFFEFLDAGGRVYLAHELEAGTEYSVVLTTAGGLYRYRLEDRVRVTGFRHRTPVLRFLGKENHISDRFGEKLSEGFVGSVLEQVLERVSARFALLAPETCESRVYYALFLEVDTVPPDVHERLEAALRVNPHYRYCVDLGQLAPARVVPVGRGAYAAYARRCTDNGQRLGDVKPRALDHRDGWSRILPPHPAAEGPTAVAHAATDGA
jgi:hypothetical protein